MNEAIGVGIAPLQPTYEISQKTKKLTSIQRLSLRLPSQEYELRPGYGKKEQQQPALSRPNHKETLLVRNVAIVS